MRRLSLLTFALAVMSTPAFADYKSEYACYRQALDAGDAAGARQHSEAAWRDAEKEIGDSRDTARLAFNYAELVVIDSPKMAREPYEHAQAIAKKIETGLNSEDIAAGLAYAISADAPEDKSARQQLETALEARRTAKLPASTVSGYGWLSLSRAALSSGDLKRAADLADRSVADADAIEASTYDKPLMRTALVTDGVAHIAPPGAQEKDWDRAAVLLDRAFPLFPTQKDIANFDRVFASGLAWRQVINLHRRVKGGTRAVVSTSSQEILSLIKAVKWEEPRNNCEIRWKNFVSPKYPEKAKAENMMGVVLVGVDFAGDRVGRIIVLAEPNKSGFSEAVVTASAQWVTEVPVEGACANNDLLFADFWI